MSCSDSSVGRASALHAEGREIETRLLYVKDNRAIVLSLDRGRDRGRHEGGSTIRRPNPLPPSLRPLSLFLVCREANRCGIGDGRVSASMGSRSDRLPRSESSFFFFQGMDDLGHRVPLLTSPRNGWEGARRGGGAPPHPDGPREARGRRVLCNALVQEGRLDPPNPFHLLRSC